MKDPRAAASSEGGVSDSDVDWFVGRLRIRLAAGARKYGCASFSRPSAELIDEIQQELEDVAGWGLILWVRLERLRGRLDGNKVEGVDGGA